MASSALHDKANGSRLSRLLVDKGVQALRQVFDTYVQYSTSGTLSDVLNANKTKLQALRYKVINSSQWLSLYPTSGSPDSKNFDITLLTVVLRQICGLPSPIAGWRTMPPDSDTSMSANVLRIKMLRNEVYAHVTTTEVDNNTFNKLWEKISKALVALGIPSSEIDELKEEALSPEEDSYIIQLQKWKEEEDELIKIALDTNATVKEILRFVQPSKDVSEIDKLALCVFTGIIRELSGSFHKGTRTWLFESLGRWFDNPDSKVMILTAGPGVGKSVFAAKVCEIYQESGQLAACHFCKFNNPDYRNPHTLLQSLAIQMCNNVEGFKDKLVEQLGRFHCKETLSGAFRVLLNNPLYALEERNPMLIVIDAMDESEVEGKSELLQLISEEFPSLPTWIKILITSRPELPVQKLSHLNPLEINPGDKENEADLLHYFQSCLSSSGLSESELSRAARKCEGSFLYAYYLQLELRELKQFTFDNLIKLAPEGIAGFYEKQFRRLRSSIGSLKLEFESFVNILSAAKGPLPLALLGECVGLYDIELRNTVCETMSSVFPVHDGCFTVYQKSLVDWLRSDGYNKHAFTADAEDGDKRLWYVCEKLFNKVVTCENLRDLKLTPELKYALKYGISHLIFIGDIKKYHWLFDLKLNYVKNRFFPFVHLQSECDTALYNLKDASSAHIEAKLFRNSLILATWLRLFDKEIGPIVARESWYLQCVANGLPVMSEDGDQEAAVSFLKKFRYIWCEDLSAITAQSNQLCATSFEKQIRCICIARNKQLAAVSYFSWTISILNWSNLEKLYEYADDDEILVSCLTFSPDCSILLYGFLGSCLDVKRREKIPFFPHYPVKFCSCSFSPSGGRLVTADGSRYVKLWDVKHKKWLMTIDVGKATLVSHECFFSNCGLFIIVKNSYSERKHGICDSEGGDEDIWDKNEIARSWLVVNALTLQRIDQRYPNFMHENVPVGDIGIDWFEYSTVTEKKMEFVLVKSGGWSCSTVVLRLPHGLPICRLRGIEPFEVTKHLNRDCILAYKDANKSFVTLDLVQKSVVAERRIYWLPVYHESPFFVTEESFVVLGYPFFFLKTPNQLPFLSSSCNVKITCCSFSQNGLFLATCDDHGVVRIWDVERCCVTQTHTIEYAAISCWWSATSLWLVFPDHLQQIPAPVKQKLQFSEAKNTAIRNEDTKFLSFSEGVLILQHNSNAICVIKIVDDELQNNTILSTDGLFDSAAVSRDSCIILLSSATKYQVWQEIVPDGSVWYPSFPAAHELHFNHNFSLDDKVEFSSKCCIATEGLLGVIVSFIDRVQLNIPVSCLGYVVVDLMSGAIVQQQIRRGMPYIWSETIFATSSFLFFINRGYFFILRLEDCTLAAVWYRSPHSMESSVFGFYPMYNLLAITESDGYINFVKIHGI